MVSEDVATDGVLFSIGKSVLNNSRENSWWINMPIWSKFYFLDSHINCDPSSVYFFAASSAICVADGIEVIVVGLDFTAILREHITPRTYRSTPAVMLLKVFHVCPLGATVYNSKAVLQFVLPPQDSLYYVLYLYVSFRHFCCDTDCQSIYQIMPLSVLGLGIWQGYIHFKCLTIRSALNPYS
jgi:hypothetical protein